MLKVMLATILVCLFRQDAAAIFSRAVELQQQGKFIEAAEAYQAALKIKPDYVEAQANLGVVLVRLGRYEEAVAAYDAAYRLAPHLTPILLNLGIAHYRAGQYVKAIEVFEKFLSQQPGVTQARRLYGLSLAALGRDEEAIKELAPTLDVAPPDAAAFYALGLSQLRAARPGFRATLERLASFPEGLPALHLLQGQAFLRDREFEQALEELKEAEKLNPELPRLHIALGVVYQQLGRHQEAVKALENEVRRAPQDPGALYQLAYSLEASGELTLAKQRIDESLKLAPQSPESNGLAGKILFKQGKAADAIKPLEFAVSRKQDDQELRYTLARVYQQLGRREDAAREFAEVQKLKTEQLKKDRANTPKP